VLVVGVVRHAETKPGGVHDETARHEVEPRRERQPLAFRPYEAPERFEGDEALSRMRALLAGDPGRAQ